MVDDKLTTSLKIVAGRDQLQTVTLSLGTDGKSQPLKSAAGRADEQTQC